MVYRQLGGTSTYNKKEQCCQATIKIVNNNFIKKNENVFLKEKVDYFTKFEHESSNPCRLPKVLLSRIVSKAIKEQNSEYAKHHVRPTK